MSIRAGIKRVAAEYLSAKTESLAGHPLAQFIRNDLPAEIDQVVNRAGDEQWIEVQATRLPGRWPSAPWIALRDPRLTPTIQAGVYVVLLFAEDMHAAYLALAMGVTDTPAELQAAWQRQIPTEFPAPADFQQGPLPEGTLGTGRLALAYADAAIWYKAYPTDDLPDESTIVQDLRAMATLLRQLGDSGNYVAPDAIEDASDSDPILGDTSATVTISGKQFTLSRADVERAFIATTESQWRTLSGIEPHWHIVVGASSKPIKAVFRNLPGVPAGFHFTKDEAARAFRRLGFDVTDLNAARAPELALIGTWKDEAAIEGVRATIAARGGWASRWSFPIREDFRERLSLPFYVYLNTGGARMPYRMRVDAFETSTGNGGIVSPWPSLTDPEALGVTREGPKTSEIFKTWFRVAAIEPLSPALTRADIVPAPGTIEAALFNQAAFGYAYLKNGAANEPASAEEAARPSVNDHAPINRIFFGPPGTGKTYTLRQLFAEYTDTPNAADPEAWLQGMLGEHGWLPVIAAALADLGGVARVPAIRDHPWIRAKAKQRGRAGMSTSALWSYLQEHTPEDVPTVKTTTRRPPFLFTKHDTGEWALLPDWREADQEIGGLFDALKAGPGGARKPIQRYRVVTFHPSFSYEDFVRGIRPVPVDQTGTTQFRSVDGVFKQICDEARGNPTKRYAIFIDEINRANIAKVFGELITLIELDKRGVFDAEDHLIQGMEVELPGSGDDEVAERRFAVPRNLDIYGTMNTADRSIALLDIALRRRFEFREMEPKYDILSTDAEGVNVRAVLQRINDRLEYLLDRDHRIGHAYLLNATSLADLRQVFRAQVIPLLQEYFFDDLAQVALVLATAAGSPFVTHTTRAHADLFPGKSARGARAERALYAVTDPATWSAASFAGLYAAVSDEADPPEPADDDEFR